MIRPREIGQSLSLFAARTPTLLPATHTNSYALGGRDVLLVEPATPYDDEQREWVAWARGLVSAGRNIVAILATHHHPDHIGGAAFLSRELGLPVWAHAETASRIEDDVEVTRRLVDGEELVLAGPRDERWKVLHTPGHAPGHVCLFETRSKTAIVGDMVASVGTILIAPGDGDMAVYLAQLDRLAALDASVALPAHGDPIDAPTALFRHYIKHRLLREEKIVGVLAKHEAGLSSTELVPLAYDDASPMVWPIAKLSVDAHFEKLEREGRIARTDKPDTFRVVR